MEAAARAYEAAKTVGEAAAGPGWLVVVSTVKHPKGVLPRTYRFKTEAAGPNLGEDSVPVLGWDVHIGDSGTGLQAGALALKTLSLL